MLWKLSGNSARRVEISASDISGDKSGISGLKSITYSLYDENGKEIRKETVNVSGNSASISFDISPNFKGHIKAFATDNVGNNGAKLRADLLLWKIQASITKQAVSISNSRRLQRKTPAEITSITTISTFSSAYQTAIQA